MKLLETKSRIQGKGVGRIEIEGFKSSYRGSGSFGNGVTSLKHL